MPSELVPRIGQPQYAKGYPSLAHFIASDYDKSTAIYRRFDQLSARNLLYLQSELAELEARQQKQDAEDFKESNTIEKQRVRDWETLRRKAADPANVRERERMDLILETREKLKEYRKAILLESMLSSFEAPSVQVLRAYRNVFHNVDHPNGGFPTLGGRSAHILDDADDLMSLVAPPEDDRLTKFLRRYFRVLFLTRRTDSQLAYISERKISVVVSLINIVMATVLLFGSIYSLHQVSDQNTRLGLIAVYTIAFAICVGLLTTAKRQEIFTACATYAAVLVVFISGNLASG